MNNKKTNKYYELPDKELCIILIIMSIPLSIFSGYVSFRD